MPGPPGMMPHFQGAGSMSTAPTMTSASQQHDHNNGNSPTHPPRPQIATEIAQTTPTDGAPTDGETEVLGLEADS